MLILIDAGGSWIDFTYWMIMLLAPLTILNPLPLMIPLDPDPKSVLSDATVIPSTPALSLHPCQLLQDECRRTLVLGTHYVTDTEGASGS
jgi:hypothetical protein